MCYIQEFTCTQELRDTCTYIIQLFIDAFGQIADNAGGIAEITKLENNVRKRTDILGTIGNTTAETGKGFAIASAALTSLACIKFLKM